MPQKKFPYGKTLLIGLGFLGINLIWPVFNSFVPLFLQAGNPEFERQLIEAGREIPNIAGFALLASQGRCHRLPASPLAAVFSPVGHNTFSSSSGAVLDNQTSAGCVSDCWLIP